VSARVSHSIHVHRGLVSPLPVGNDFVHLGGGTGVNGSAAYRPGHVTVCPGIGATISSGHTRL
jgi:hypothetical protein